MVLKHRRHGSRNQLAFSASCLQVSSQHVVRLLHLSTHQFLITPQKCSQQWKQQQHQSLQKQSPLLSRLIATLQLMQQLLKQLLSCVAKAASLLAKKRLSRKLFAASPRSLFVSALSKKASASTVVARRIFAVSPAKSACSQTHTEQACSSAARHRFSTSAPWPCHA